MRSLFVLVVLVSIPARADDKKAVDDKKKPDYYPLAKGHKWEYEITTDDKEKEIEIIEVAETEMKDGKLIATIKVSGRSFLATHVYRVDDTAVLEMRWNDIKYDPPIPRLKFPLKAGEKWSLNEKNADTRVVLTWVVGEPIEVKVLAGKFKAVPVEHTETLLGLKSTKTFYYADGIGLVRRETLFGGKKILQELKKFTPGK